MMESVFRFEEKPTFRFPASSKVF